MIRTLLAGAVFALWLASSANAFFIGFGSANAVEEGIKKGQELRKIPAVLAPCDMRAEVVSESRINIFWNDKSDDEMGFEVERKQADGFFMEIAVTGANRGFYVDDGLSPDTVYCYRVRAYNSRGFSEYSPEVCVRTRPLPGTPAATVTLAATVIPSRTGSATTTSTPAPVTETPVHTLTPTPTITLNSTATSSPALTSIASSTPTQTATGTSTQTATGTLTQTTIGTPTQTATGTLTPTATGTPTQTATGTPATKTPTQTATETPTPTLTASHTPTETVTATVTP